MNAIIIIPNIEIGKEYTVIKFSDLNVTTAAVPTRIFFL